MAIFPPIRQIQTGALRQLLPPALLLVVLLMAPLGCGRTGRLGVQGKVTVNGQPLESGNISFASTAPGGGPSAGAAITNGAYSVPAENGLLPGEYQVQIHSFRRTGKKT